MPACPECGKPLNFKRRLFADRTAGFPCEHCGAVLHFNRERSTALMAVFFLLAIIPAVYDASWLFTVIWVLASGAMFTVAIVALGKVESLEL
jgi:predicted nucleic acid-binding Zn ribbon protein